MGAGIPSDGSKAGMHAASSGQIRDLVDLHVYTRGGSEASMSRPRLAPQVLDPLISEVAIVSRLGRSVPSCAGGCMKSLRLTLLIASVVSGLSTESYRSESALMDDACSAAHRMTERQRRTGKYTRSTSWWLANNLCRLAATGAQPIIVRAGSAN